MAEHDDSKDEKKVDIKDDIRLDVSNNFYDKLDGLINDSYEEDNINYVEIELAFLKMNDKILQQKITLMHQYLHSSDADVSTNKSKKEPSGVYG